MERRETVRRLIAGGVALAVLGGVSAWISRGGGSWAVTVESLEPASLPVMIELKTPPVRARLGRRVPSNVNETAAMTPAPWAPGVHLVQADARGGWERRRALIQDTTTQDTRSYAIGDLLPYGSLLVGISTSAADILVADVELVRLYEDGRVRSLVDFRTAYEARPLPRARDLPDTYRRLIDEWIERLLVEEVAEVQGAIDVLVSSGELGVEQLIPHSGSTLPVVAGPYTFSGVTGSHLVQTQGQIVMRILGAVTGQAFTDARAWERWWSGN